MPTVAALKKKTAKKRQAAIEMDKQLSAMTSAYRVLRAAESDLEEAKVAVRNAKIDLANATDSLKDAEREFCKSVYEAGMDSDEFLKAVRREMEQWNKSGGKTKFSKKTFGQRIAEVEAEKSTLS